ncbi:22383_t:CDS:2, partial [Entrophospora sp. SA101]
MSTLGFIVAYRKLEKSIYSSLPVDKAPGVSIIRPLKGIDCNLYDNLLSTFLQDYSNFEILFSVATENDPSIEV